MIKHGQVVDMYCMMTLAAVCAAMLPGISIEAVEHCMMAAAEQLPRLGWPVPPHYSVWQVVTQLSDGGINADFSFGDVVKGLCANTDLKALMQTEDAAMVAAAAAAAQANTAKQG